MTRSNTLRILLLSSLALTLSQVGCGSPRRRWQPEATGTGAVTTGGGTTVAATGVVASGSPRQQLEQLDGLLRQQQMAPIGPAVHGRLDTNGLIAYAVDAEASACYTLAVLGEEPAQNLDMVVLDPYGRPAGHNVRPDNHPWVSFCASQPGRFIVRVNMAAGSGSYFYTAYQGPADRRMELSSFYGETPTTAVQTATMDPQTQQRLGSIDQQMQQRNFSRVGQPAGLVLDNAEPRDFQLNLQQGQCYAFATLGGPGAVDTDIFLNDAAGQRLQADTARAQDAMIEYCAPVSGPYVLQVRMYQGQGSLFTVGYQSAARGGAQEPVIASTSTAGAGVQENYALLDADMRARGYESYGQQTSGQLAPSGTRNFEIQLEGGRCYAILAVGGGSVRNLDLVLVDSRGRPVDQDTATDARPTVRVCPRSSGNYSMQVRMTEGSGEYIYASYRWPRGTHGPFGLEGVTWVRLSEVTALLGVEGYNPDPGFTPGNGRLRTQGSSARHNVELSGGQCYAVVVVGGEGVNDLDVTVQRGSTPLASDTGSNNAFPSVRHCPTSDGTYTIRITAASGAGPYHYQIFSQGEPGS